MPGQASSRVLKTFAGRARGRIWPNGIEVDAKEARIMGAKSLPLCPLVAASSAKTAAWKRPFSMPKWRTMADEDGHYSLAFPYDAAACDALQLASLRCSAIWYYASSIPGIAGWSAYPSIAVIPIGLPDRRERPCDMQAQDVERRSLTNFGSILLGIEPDGAMPRS